MADDKQKLEQKIEDLDAERAGKEEEIQQLVGREQMRTSPDPSHEKIRQEKELPTPDPDHLSPEDGGNQTDPKEIETDEALFDKKLPEDKAAQEEAEKAAKGDETPSKPATLGDTTTKENKDGRTKETN